MKNAGMIRAAGLILAVCAAGKAWSAETPSSATPGAPAFQASPERPVGWRGDGTGRYPGATPPVSWERKKSDSGYETKGILWMTPLPNIGVSCPIIVGQRIFLTTEFSDLLCLDKQTGQILWIRSNLEFEGLSDEERKADPAYDQNLMPLLPQLAKANADLADALNALQPAATTSAHSTASAALAKKQEVEKQCQDAQLAIDKKRYERYWGQAVYGFSGATPTSDGSRVYAFFATGISVCYDLKGNRQWIVRGKGEGTEHGNFASPVLCGNRLVVWAKGELRAYDTKTGKLAWLNPYKSNSNNSYGSLFRVQAGPDLVAGFQAGWFARASDGKPVWGDNLFGDGVSTPIVEGTTLYASVGYGGWIYDHPPHPGPLQEGLRAIPIPSTADSTKLKESFAFKTDWAPGEIPIDKDKKPFERSYTASPLFVDGLIYRITEGGGLTVNRADTGEIVYRKILTSLKPRTQYSNWAGASSSPTLAGKYIYFMDNQGTTIIIQPGNEYRQVAQNLIEESRDGKEQVQNLASPVFEGTRMYYRTPGYLYCIGEK